MSAPAESTPRESTVRGSTPGESPARSTVHDARGLWRVLLAVVVPIPWLAKGIEYIVLDLNYEHTADQISYDMTHNVYRYLQWLDLLFVVLVVPSILAMVGISRRGAPRLAAAATILMGGGFLMVLPLNIDSDQLTWVAARHGLDPAVIGPFIDDAANDPRTSLGGLGFVVAIVIGSILLALALWRSRAIAGWAAALVGLGGATHVFIGALGRAVLGAGPGHVVLGSGLVVLAIGCAAVSRRLLTMSNDDFDLPPAVPVTTRDGNAGSPTGRPRVPARSSSAA